LLVPTWNHSEKAPPSSKAAALRWLPEPARGISEFSSSPAVSQRARKDETGQSDLPEFHRFIRAPFLRSPSVCAIARGGPHSAGWVTVEQHEQFRQREFLADSADEAGIDDGVIGAVWSGGFPHAQFDA
jgi:hypothetical protein